MILICLVSVSAVTYVTDDNITTDGSLYLTQANAGNTCLLIGAESTLNVNSSTFSTNASFATTASTALTANSTTYWDGLTSASQITGFLPITGGDVNGTFAVYEAGIFSPRLFVNVTAAKVGINKVPGVDDATLHIVASSDSVFGNAVIINNSDGPENAVDLWSDANQNLRTVLGVSQFNGVWATNRFYRNLSGFNTARAVVEIINDDAADDQPALELNQAGSGDYLTAGNFVIQADGDVGIGTTSPVSKLELQDGTFTIDQDTNNIGLNIDSEATSANTISLTNEGSGKAIYIDNNGAGSGIQIDSEATTGGEASAGISVNTGQGATAIHAEYGANANGYMTLANNPNGSQSASFYFYRDLASTGTDCPMMAIRQENSGDDQDGLIIHQDGSGNALLIDQNGNGRSLYIDSEATTQQGLLVTMADTSYIGIETNANIKGNFYYGDMYIYDNDTATSFASSGVYYNITNGMTEGDLNGFTYSSGVLTVPATGVYQCGFSTSFSGGLSDEYHSAIGVNGVRSIKCHIQRKLGTGGDVGAAAGSCMLSLTASDELTLMMENVDSSDDPTVHDGNVNCKWVGN